MNKQPRLFREDEIEVVTNLTLEEANTICLNVITMVEAHCFKIQVVGSMRRRRPVVRDIDYVVICDAKGWRNMTKSLETILDAKQTMSGDLIKRLLVPFKRGCVQVDFYRSPPELWGIYELIRTGSSDHNIWLAKYTLKKGMRLRYSVGLINSEGKVVASETEEAIFEALGLEWIPPAQREIKNKKPVWLK